jgi:hypothetical protein
MRGIYEASIHIAGLNALKSLMIFQVPAAKHMSILSAQVSNASNNTNQQLEAGFYKITTLGSPVGTAVTPGQIEVGDAASAITVTANLTTEPTTYSATAFGLAGFSSLAGWQYQPVPEERLLMAASTNWGLKLTDTAPTAFDCDVYVRWQEIG